MKKFSKLSKKEKMQLVIDRCFKGDQKVAQQLKSFWHSDKQDLFDQFSENTLSNFYVPFGVVPNVVINDREYMIPMAIEESSVVAACAKSAGFWKSHGGFHSEVVSTTKVGQVHFNWNGNSFELLKFFESIKLSLLQETTELTLNMDRRGGGVKSIALLDKTNLDDDYYQIMMEFETCDAMGANFINSVLELVAQSFKERVEQSDLEGELEIIMAILSNYTPECLVRSWVECPVEEIGEEFAHKFVQAVRIARLDPYRATTHNKGIFNGIDAVVMATGNDFRAVEAAGHTYATRDGQYRGLTNASLCEGVFRFDLEIPVSIGTVGGLTSLHPMAAISLEMLGNPSAGELMSIICTIGLAQNYAALRSLVTSGIQRGHMKMHLMNILNRMDASQKERELAASFFSDKTVSYAAARDFLTDLRGLNNVNH